MEADGGGNAIAWNFCEFSAQQLRVALERAEYNAANKFKAIIPLIAMAFHWVEKHPSISDQALYEAIR